MFMIQIVFVTSGVIAIFVVHDVDMLSPCLMLHAAACRLFGLLLLLFMVSFRMCGLAACGINLQLWRASAAVPQAAESTTAGTEVAEANVRFVFWFLAC